RGCRAVRRSEVTAGRGESDPGVNQALSDIGVTAAGRTTRRSAVVHRRFARRRLELVFLLGPALALFLVFVIFPVVQALHYSVYDWSGLGPLTKFVGVDNYQRAFDDPVFRGALQHNFILVALSVILQFPIALGVALLMNQPLRGRALLRTIFFAPYVLSE